MNERVSSRLPFYFKSHGDVVDIFVMEKFTQAIKRRPAATPDIDDICHEEVRAESEGPKEMSIPAELADTFVFNFYRFPAADVEKGKIDLDTMSPTYTGFEAQAEVLKVAWRQESERSRALGVYASALEGQNLVLAEQVAYLRRQNEWLIFSLLRR